MQWYPFFGINVKPRKERIMLKQKRDVLIASLVVIAVAVLSLFSALLLYSYAYSGGLTEMRLQNQVLVNHMEGTLAVKSALTENNASVIRNFPDCGNDPIVTLFDEQAERIEAVALVFAGFPDGSMILNTGWQPVGHVYGPERPWYIAAAQNPGEVVFVRPYMGSVSLQFVIAAARTVAEDSAESGVVAVSLYFSALTDYVSSNDGVSQSLSFIIDSEGYILYHPDPAFAPFDDFTF